METKTARKKPLIVLQPLEFHDYEESGPSGEDMTIPDGKRKQMLKGLLICQGVAPLLYMNIGAFFPSYAYVNYGLSETSIGILFSLYQVAFLITAFNVGTSLHRIGRKTAVKFTIALMAIATVLFGFASQFSGSDVFYTVSAIARLIQGAAAGIIEVAVPAIISLQFPENNELYQGYAVMAMGLGLTLGPVFGALVFEWLDYTQGMIAFALIVSIVGGYGVSLIPNQLNSELSSPTIRGEIDEDFVRKPLLAAEPAKVLYNENETRVTFKMILGNKTSFAALLAYGVATMSLVFLNPILTIHLMGLGTTEQVGGLGFAVLALAFGVGAPCMGQACQLYERKRVMLACIALEVVALLLLGPARFLNTDSIALIFVGLALNGLAIAGVFVPIMPLLVKAVQTELIAKDPNLSAMESSQYIALQNKVSDVASSLQAIYSGSFAFMAPIISGSVTEFMGYKSATSLFAIFAAISGLIFTRVL